MIPTYMYIQVHHTYRENIDRRVLIVHLHCETEECWTTNDLLLKELTAVDTPVVGGLDAHQIPPSWGGGRERERERVEKAH